MKVTLHSWTRDRAARELTGSRAALARSVSRVFDHIRLPLFRNGYTLLFNGAATSGLGLVYWALAARLYPAAVVGLNSALVAAMLLLSGIAQLSLNNVLVRFIPISGSLTRRLILYSYLASGLAAIVVSVIFVRGVDFWSPALSFLNQSLAWQWLFVLAIAAWCIFSLQDSVLTGLRQTVWIPIENTSFAIAKILLLVLLAGWVARAGVFLSWTVPVAISLLPVNALIFGWLLPAQIAPPRTVAPEIYQIVRYAGSNYVGSLLFLAYTNLLPLVAANRAGAEAAAYFYIPWIISGGLQLVAANLSISLTVEAAIEHEQLRSYCRRVLKQSFRLLIPIVAVIVVGAPWLLRLFGPNYALQGAALMRWLALAALPNVIVVLALSIARVQHRSGWVILIQGTVCFLALGISYVLLPVFGIVAVGWGWFGSQVITASVLILTIVKPIYSEP
jgi:O-antigen/teichoic acid export membrane protein